MDQSQQNPPKKGAKSQSRRSQASRGLFPAPGGPASVAPAADSTIGALTAPKLERFAPANPLPPAIGKGSRLRPQKIVALKHKDELGVCELLDRLKLLGPEYLYTALPDDKVRFTRIHGTYCQVDGTPINKVFCCELVTEGRDRNVVQVGAPEYTLWRYLQQNGGPTSASIAVYHRNQLTPAYLADSRAQFEFIDPHAAREALIAVVTIMNFKD